METEQGTYWCGPQACAPARIAPRMLRGCAEDVLPGCADNLHDCVGDVSCFCFSSSVSIPKTQFWLACLLRCCLAFPWLPCFLPPNLILAGHVLNSKSSSVDKAAQPFSLVRLFDSSVCCGGYCDYACGWCAPVAGLFCPMQCSGTASHFHSTALLACESRCVVRRAQGRTVRGKRGGTTCRGSSSSSSPWGCAVPRRSLAGKSSGCQEASCSQGYCRCRQDHCPSATRRCARGGGIERCFCRGFCRGSCFERTLAADRGAKGAH